jgi:hypothetical protein
MAEIRAAAPEFPNTKEPCSGRVWGLLVGMGDLKRTPLRDFHAGARREARRLRRLGDAGAVPEHPRGAQGRAARRGPLRREPHGRGRRRGARAPRVPERPGDERRRQDVPGQGPLLADVPPGRRGDRRPPGLHARARRTTSCASTPATSTRTSSGSGQAAGRDVTVDGPLGGLRRSSPSRARGRPAIVQSLTGAKLGLLKYYHFTEGTVAGRPLHHQPHGLHGRGRLRALPRRGRRPGPRRGAPRRRAPRTASSSAASGPATACGSRRASRSTATSSRARFRRWPPASAGP